MDPVADVLEHYGMKGMKWGVRKDHLNTFKPGVDKYETREYRFGIGSGPKVGEVIRTEHSGEQAVVRHVAPAGKEDVHAVEKTLGHKLKPDEKVFNVTMQTEAQTKAMLELIAKNAAKHSDPISNILAHYGVRGMKWGIRKKRSAPSGPRSADAQQVKDIIDNIHKNGIGAASNADLKVLEGRAKLENKYKDIYPKKKTVVDHGMEIAKRVLLPVAEQQAKAFLNDKAAAALKGKEIVEAMEIGRHSVGGGRHLKKA